MDIMNISGMDNQTLIDEFYCASQIIGNVAFTSYSNGVFSYRDALKDELMKRLNDSGEKCCKDSCGNSCMSCCSLKDAGINSK